MFYVEGLGGATKQWRNWIFISLTWHHFGIRMNTGASSESTTVYGKRFDGMRHSHLIYGTTVYVCSCVCVYVCCVDTRHYKSTHSMYNCTVCEFFWLSHELWCESVWRKRKVIWTNIFITCARIRSEIIFLFPFFLPSLGNLASLYLLPFEKLSHLHFTAHRA